MLINNFKYSGGAKDAVNYVMSDYDHEGKLRSVKPRIFEGDPALTKQICEDFCGDFKNKCVSGVIAFADNEHPTEEQKRQVVADFKKTFLAGMDHRVNCLFVVHEDKQNTEIHYIINKIDLLSGKHFVPFPPGEETKNLIKLFCAEQNFKLGYEQVVASPFKTKYSADERKCLDKDNHNIKNLKTKREIDIALNKLVKNGTLKNRGELLDYLREHDFKITRQGQDYISIENPSGGRNIRFKGGIYDKHNGLDYKEVLSNFLNQPKPTHEDTRQKLDKILANREEFMSKRFGVKKSEPAKEAPAKQAINPPPATPQKQPEAAPIVRPGTVPPVAPMPVSKGSTDNPAPIGAPAVNGSLAAAHYAHENALARLRNAKTWLERIQAEREVIKAKFALDKAEQDDFEQKRKIKVKI